MNARAAQQGHGDGGSYPCPHCPTEHQLDALLDHIEIAHGWTWTP